VAALALLGALPGCKPKHPAAHTVGTPPVRIEEVRWAGETPQTPPLEGEGMVFSLHRALYQGKRAISLHARYRVPGLYRARYGDNVEHALFVVAVNEDNQRIWTAPVVPTAESELGSWARDPMVDEAGPEDAPLEGTFNMDLRQALELPHQEAPYMVFLWLDEMVSAPDHILVPASQRSDPSPAPRTGLTWLHEIPGPDATGPSVELHLSPTDPCRILGRVTRLPDAARQPLLVLATARPGLQVSWNRGQFPVARGPELLRGQNFEFDFQPTTIFRAGDVTTGRIWSIAIFTGEMSQPVSDDAAAQPPSAPAAEDEG